MAIFVAAEVTQRRAFCVRKRPQVFAKRPQDQQAHMELPKRAAADILASIPRTPPEVPSVKFGCAVG